MNSYPQRITTLAAAVLAVAGVTPLANAQSSDALLDKLVEKGVLTQKEAKELREESDAGFNQAYHAKSGLPDWVTSMRIYGDFRVRYEGFFFENDDATDRNRFRYRLRVGLTATLKDDFEVGMRLTSSEPVGTFGGDPISGNTTLQNNASKKYIWVDQAYAKWTPLHNAGWVGSATVGKMENPFQVSDMLFDPDYTPEGIAGTLAYSPNDRHTVSLTGGAFILDEIWSPDRGGINGGHDELPMVGGLQAQWNANWGQKWASTLSVAWFPVSGSDLLTTNSVPQIGAGNPLKLQPGFPPAVAFSPVVVGSSLAYTFDHAPLYQAAFPVRISGEYLNNPVANDDNVGWWAGVTFGKAGKKRLWEIGYRYMSIQSSAWWDQFTESDFGAYYSNAYPGSGLSGPGYFSGVNVQGHVIRAIYNFYDSTSLTVTYWLTSLIDTPPGLHDSRTGRLQVDVSWKF